ncbi:YdcF family protein [Tsukamurella soli]|uniref:YdcF family protein n=1 Tax=Tsukamurella soli TaxID=644556 RepID=A0ABP8K6D0_9ACTN
MGVVLRRSIWCVVLAAVLVFAGIGGVGYWEFGRDHEDPLRKVDAIIVLGGDHDGREAYGIRLAHEGYAKTVVLSDPYGRWDDFMNAMCAAGDAQVTVLCEVPDPGTTRGEALFTERLARQYGWHTVMVISWGYHLPRARYIFRNCFDGGTVMRAVPRAYHFNLADWELTYIYQAVGTVKAAVQGHC